MVFLRPIHFRRTARQAITIEGIRRARECLSRRTNAMADGVLAYLARGHRSFQTA